MDWDHVRHPAKRLFGLHRDSGSRTFSPSTPGCLPAPRSDAAARSRNSCSTPSGFPFNVKTATPSRPASRACGAPVFVGHAGGADTPKSLRLWLGARVAGAWPIGYPVNASAEDRATLGSDLSAVGSLIDGRADSRFWGSVPLCLAAGPALPVSGPKR